MRFTIRDVLWLTIVAGLIAGWRCWSHSVPVADGLMQGDGLIQGIVLVSGKPVDSGRVFLHSTDGQFRGTQLQKGHFVLERVPFGKYRVIFEGDNVPANRFDAEIDDRCRALGVTFNIGP